MPINNDLYNTLADSWWNKPGALGALRPSPPPGLDTCVSVLVEELGDRSQRKKDPGRGLGGGYPPRSSPAGCRVTGIDPFRAFAGRRPGTCSTGEFEIDYRPGLARRDPVPGRLIRDGLLLRHPRPHGREAWKSGLRDRAGAQDRRCIPFRYDRSESAKSGWC